MIGGLEFLNELSALCRQELAKRNQEDADAATKVVFAAPLTRGPSKCDRSRRRKVDKETKVAHQANSDVNLEIPQVQPEKNNEEVDPKSSCGSTSKGYSCAKCNYFSKNRSQYSKHMLSQSHLGLVQCSYCLELIKKNELDDHLVSAHLSSNLSEHLNRTDDGYSCTKCNVSFKTFSFFKRHLKSMQHNNMQTCKSCNGVFRTEEIEKHLKEIHGRDGSVSSCKICGASFASRGNLTRHISSVHVQKDNFKCEECGMTFCRGDGYRRHLATHLNQRVFACCFCILTFKAKDALVNHINSIHFKKRYQCTKCYRYFDDEERRDLHAKTHDGYKFVCMVCGRPFATYSKRERHYKTHINTPKKLRIRKKLKKATIASEEGVTSNSYLKDKSIVEAIVSVGDISASHQNSQTPGVENKKKFETNSSELDESFEDIPIAHLLSTKRKRNVKEKSPDKLTSLKSAKRPKLCKSDLPTSESSNRKIKTINSNSTKLAEVSKSEDCKLEQKEQCDKNCFPDLEEPILESYTSKEANVVSDSFSNNVTMSDQNKKASNKIDVDKVMNDSNCYVEIAGSNMWVRNEVLEGNKETVASSDALQLSAAIPEKTLFIDVNNLTELDTTIESLSTLRPDSSVTESTLVIDVDNLPFCEELEVKDLTDCISVDNFQIQYIQVETDSGVSLCNADDASQDELLALKSAAEAVKEAPVKNGRTKATVQRQRSRKSVKSKKYPDTGKKVTVKNLCNNDDDFSLPEFVLEDED